MNLANQSTTRDKSIAPQTKSTETAGRPPLAPPSAAGGAPARFAPCFIVTFRLDARAHERKCNTRRTRHTARHTAQHSARHTALHDGHPGDIFHRYNDHDCQNLHHEGCRHLAPHSRSWSQRCRTQCSQGFMPLSWLSVSPGHEAPSVQEEPNESRGPFHPARPCSGDSSGTRYHACTQDLGSGH